MSYTARLKYGVCQKRKSVFYEAGNAIIRNASTCYLSQYQGGNKLRKFTTCTCRFQVHSQLESKYSPFKVEINRPCLYFDIVSLYHLELMQLSANFRCRVLE